MARASIGWLCLLLVGLTGCASVDLRAGFPEVSAVVEERAATKIVWNRRTELDNEAAEKLRALLQKKLAADDAVQIAMLNNRDLQAIYTDLGVAQADLPGGLFEYDPRAPYCFRCRGPTDLQLSVYQLLDALYVRSANGWPPPGSRKPSFGSPGPSRPRGAGSAGFHEHQANGRCGAAADDRPGAPASWEVSRRLHEAGNITDLDQARDRAAAEVSRLALRSAEILVRQSREHLNDLMGTWGEQTVWEIDGRLPDIPAEPLPVNGLERVALSRSIDLSQARQRIITAGQQLGYDRRRP